MKIFDQHVLLSDRQRTRWPSVLNLLGPVVCHRRIDLSLDELGSAEQISMIKEK